MALKSKIKAALIEAFSPEYLELCEVDRTGVSGYVVSPEFQDLSELDRQELLRERLLSTQLAPIELRKVLLIVPLTPEEATSMGLPTTSTPKRAASGSRRKTLSTR